MKSKHNRRLFIGIVAATAATICASPAGLIWFLTSFIMWLFVGIETGIFFNFGIWLLVSFTLSALALTAYLFKKLKPA